MHSSTELRSCRSSDCTVARASDLVDPLPSQYILVFTAVPYIRWRGNQEVAQRSCTTLADHIPELEPMFS